MRSSQPREHGSCWGFLEAGDGSPSSQQSSSWSPACVHTWKLQMVPNTWNSRHRGKGCQSQDWGQDWGRSSCSAHHCAFLQPMQSYPYHRLEPEEHPPFFNAARAAVQPSHVDCFARRLFLALGLPPGMLRASCVLSPWQEGDVPHAIHLHIFCSDAKNTTKIHRSCSSYAPPKSLT